MGHKADGRPNWIETGLKTREAVPGGVGQMETAGLGS